MKILGLVFSLLAAATLGSDQEALEILGRLDRNLSSANRIVEADMTVQGRRQSRRLSLRTWSVGDKKSFTEILAPAAEQGTKMLKLEDRLWIYTPQTDRIIQISGHMLRQPLLGSDLSYEDIMEHRRLQETYQAEIEREDSLDGVRVWVLALTAKIPNAAYHRQRLWVDQQRYVPLLQELYAKSGQLLKRAEFRDFENIEGRVFPTRLVYKDVLKQGGGTEFRIVSIKFDQRIPEHLFSKASLRR